MFRFRRWRAAGGGNATPPKSPAATNAIPPLSAVSEKDTTPASGIFCSQAPFPSCTATQLGRAQPDQSSRTLPPPVGVARTVTVRIALRDAPGGQLAGMARIVTGYAPGAASGSVSMLRVAELPETLVALSPTVTPGGVPSTESATTPSRLFRPRVTMAEVLVPWKRLTASGLRTSDSPEGFTTRLKSTVASGTPPPLPRTCTE